MASLNYVVLVGNLTRDPEARQLPSGTSVADLGLAVNESYKNKAGEMVETTTFVDIVVWGKQAESCSQYLHKGSPILVEGRLQLDQWTGQDGEKRSKLRVRADRVQFLGGPRREGSGETPASPAPRARSQTLPAPPPAPAADTPPADDEVPF